MIVFLYIYTYPYLFCCSHLICKTISGLPEFVFCFLDLVDVSRMHEAYHTFESLFTHMNAPWFMFLCGKRFMSHVWMSLITQINIFSHICVGYAMIHLYRLCTRQKILTCVTWLAHTCDITQPHPICETAGRLSYEWVVSHIRMSHVTRMTTCVSFYS